MDADRSQRIEDKLDELHRDLVPRHEHDRREAKMDARFDRIELKLDQVIRDQSSHDTRLGVAETKLGTLNNLGDRMGAVEDVAAVQRKRESRKAWTLPSIATIAATVLNALFTAIVYLATPHNS